MLELNTTKQKTIPIKIDGETYQMVPYDLLAFNDFLELQKFSIIFSKSTKTDTILTKEESATLEASINKYCKLVLPKVKNNTWELLPVSAKMQIMEVFMDTVPVTVKEKDTVKKQPFQDSQGSMEELQAIGSKPQ